MNNQKLGIFRYPANEIIINKKLLLDSFKNNLGYEICNGIVCRSKASVLQSVIEHEIVHMIVENSCYEKQSHGRNFMGIAKKIFGHTKFTHDLNNIIELNNQDNIYTKFDFKLDETVRFIFKNINYTGTIEKLNRVNATVSVPNKGRFLVKYQYLFKSGDR
jgi:hypothetical protein